MTQRWTLSVVNYPWCVQSGGRGDTEVDAQCDKLSMVCVVRRAW